MDVKTLVMSGPSAAAAQSGRLSGRRTCETGPPSPHHTVCGAERKRKPQPHGRNGRCGVTFPYSLRSGRAVLRK